MTASEYRYLKAIARRCARGEAAKMTDIASDLGFARASVYKKFCLLEQQGLIRKRDDKTVVITDVGERLLSEQDKVCKACAAMLAEHTGISESLLRHDAESVAGVLSHRCARALTERGGE